MIYSLKRYFRLFTITLFFKKERLILINHFISWFFTKSFTKASFDNREKEKSLSLAINWLLSAQKNMIDGGFGTFYIVNRWTTSYPETSGYIIPTLYQFAQLHPEKKEEIEKSIFRCADWLVDIQKPSGGWQSAYMEHNRPEVIFNTGQVIRGLIIAYSITNNEKYLSSMMKACDWMVNTQEENGSWIKTAYMNEPRVYDSYVSHPLLMVNEIIKNARPDEPLGRENYKSAAIKNLDWVLSQQQQNGWFNNADNTQKYNSRPILHTIAYTIDGLINCGILLNENKYIEAGKKSADKLLNIFNEHGFLNGRFDNTWMSSEYMINTGCAQMSIIWSKQYDLTSEEKYAIAASKMNDELVYIQRSCLTIKGEGNGAIPGSFPIWGKYEPFGFPNWATKYFVDALMCEIKIGKK